MKNKALGSSFDDFLAEEGLLEEVTETAAKRVLARSIAALIAHSGKSKAQIARDMKTARSQVNRLLDEHDTGVTLHTIMAAASATGGRVRITVEAPEPDPE
jgi:DNA-binding phage protein